LQLYPALIKSKNTKKLFKKSIKKWHQTRNEFITRT
jgi:hypothetical protein